MSFRTIGTAIFLVILIILVLIKKDESSKPDPTPAVQPTTQPAGESQFKFNIP